MSGRVAAFGAVYPEWHAGGYTRSDGTVAFYQRVQALLPDGGVVLDFGAGRGVGAQEQCDVRRDLSDLRGDSRQVIGVDVDPVVLDNPRLDEAHVLSGGDRLPVPDRAVDVIVADHVFEHIDDPVEVAAELARVLRPGGWLCARTPNAYGYIALAARLVPNRLHRAVLTRAQPDRQARDVFPTRYRMNTRRRLDELFHGFDDHTYPFAPEPAYFGGSVAAVRTMRAAERLLPSALFPTLLIFKRKPARDAVR